MSMTPLQVIAATKFLYGEGLSPHIMVGLINSYEAQVSPIRSAVFSFINSLPAEERESAYGPLLTAWPAGIGWTTPAGLKNWGTELFPPVDCEKPVPEETTFVTGTPDPTEGVPVPEPNILPDATDPRGAFIEGPYGYSEIYEPVPIEDPEITVTSSGDINSNISVNVSVDPDTGVGTGTGTLSETVPSTGFGELDTTAFNTEYDKVTGKLDEVKTTLKSGFETTNTNQFLTDYNLERAFSGFKMHELPYQDKLLYEGLPFSQAVFDYCNYVLCAGDPGRFAIVVDKVSAYVSTTGSVLDVIEKAKTMKFSDFGPNVTNFGEMINMGIDKAAKDLKEQIGNIPTPPSLPQTDAKAVGTVIAAQGSVAGEPGSENAGKVLGMIEQLYKLGRTDLIKEIAKSFVQNVGLTTTGWVNVNGKEIKNDDTKVLTTSPITENVVASVISELEARAEGFVNSADSSTQLNGFYIKTWIEQKRSEGTIGTIERWTSIHVSYVYDVFLGFPQVADYKEQILVESKVEQAVNALPTNIMQKITDALGAKVDVSKLESNTGVLDIKQVAGALPKPMNVDNAPAAIRSILTTAIATALPGGLTVPKAIVLGQNLGGIATDLIKGSTNLAELGKQALEQAKNIVSGQGGIVANLKSSSKILGDKLNEIKGFSNLGDFKKLGGIFKSVETSLPSPSSFLNPVIDDATGAAKAMVPEALNSIKEVMPASIESEFKTAITATLAGIPIIGSAFGGKYKVTDFLGSPVGMNGQTDLWKSLIDNVSNTGIMLPGEGATLQDFVDALEAAATTESGKKATEAYDKIIEQFRKEWALLKKAKVDFVNLPCGDIVSSINLSKKLAQYAQKLDSGVAEIFNNAADPNTLGGQALLSVMVEARNLKTLQTAGMNPANAIESKGDKVEPSDQDREEAARIQAESGDPDAITPEQVARNRAINQSLTKALVPRTPT